jgi:hypothetical protein
VLAENEARDFDAALCGQRRAAAVQELGGVRKVKLAYGWTEIAVLARCTTG